MVRRAGWLARRFALLRTSLHCPMKDSDAVIRPFMPGARGHERRTGRPKDGSTLCRIAADKGAQVGFESLQMLDRSARGQRHGDPGHASGGTQRAPGLTRGRRFETAPLACPRTDGKLRTRLRSRRRRRISRPTECAPGRFPADADWCRAASRRSRNIPAGRSFPAC